MKKYNIKITFKSKCNEDDLIDGNYHNDDELCVSALKKEMNVNA